MGEMQLSLSEISGRSVSPLTAPVANAVNVQFTLHGGDMRSGFGWISLIAALSVPALPLLISKRSTGYPQQRNFCFVALAIGSVASLYLLSNSFNTATTIEAGFYPVLTGYALLWTGMLRDSLAHVPQPVAAFAVAA